MRDLRGVVVDIQEEKDTVIVLTPEGDVREVITNGQQFQIGDSILFYEKVVEPPKEVRWRKRAIRYATATAAAVLLFSVSPIQISDLHLGNLVRPKNVNLGGLAKNVAYAKSSVYIESKSDVKVDLKGQKVISANALNQPAKKVLKEMRWGRNEDIADFIQTYFEEAKESGYLSPKDPVVISVETTPALESEKDDLLKQIKSISKEHHIKVVAVAVPDDVVKKAEALGITPGKLVISLVAKVQTGKIIPLDELKTVTIAELIDTVPHVINTLPRFTEEKLAELVRNISVVSAPADSQPTETANTENPPVSNEAGDTMASATTTENTTTDASNDNQATDMTATDSTSNQPETVYSAGGSSSSAQPQEQPESQPQEESESTTVNNEQQPEPQTQEEGQTQDEQTQTSQPQDDQVQESQPQEGQNQEKQAPGQEQGSQHEEGQQQQDHQKDQQQNQQQDQQQQNDKQQQDDQPQDGQAQHGEQTQGEQHNDRDGKQTEDKDNSPVAAIFEWVKNVIVRG